MSDDGKVKGDSWDLYVKPKKPAQPAPTAPTSTSASDGTEVSGSPRPPRSQPTPPTSGGSDGTMELPGNPRPKVPGATSENPNPKAKSSSDDEAEFRRQKPKSAEEDAEVWDSRKGWTTPSGKKEGLAPGADGKVDTVEGAAVSEEYTKKMEGHVEEDEDTEVIVAPKRREASDAPMRGSPQPRGHGSSGALMGAANVKQGRDGQDFQEYTRPTAPTPTMVGGVAPQHMGGSFGSIMPGHAPQGHGANQAGYGQPPSQSSGFIEYGAKGAPAASGPSMANSPFASLGGAATGSNLGPGGASGAPKLYGQSAVASPAPAAARPSGRTEIHDVTARHAPAGSPSGAPPYAAASASNLGMAAAASPTTAPGGLSADPRNVHAKPLPAGVPLNILLIGSGAREHAMALAIRRSNRAHLYVVMKHRNPALGKSATGFKILDDRDAAGIVAWARMQKIHIAVVGPESALESGVTDALRAAGIAVASPSQAAARIETSKTHMRNLMERHQVPGRLGYAAFVDEEAALRFLDERGPEWAIKPVGLTGGKGVQVFGDHFHDLDGAKAYVRSVFAGKVGGGAVQFEEVARGEEFTLMAFTDGTTVLPMPAVQDHKRLFEGDHGPNTGGMGSYSQADHLLPFLTPADREEAIRILHGLVGAMRAEGTPYVGTIYGQFMLTATGPKVIEVNARFGDPEAMNVLPLLESDYLSILEGMATGTLAGREARFAPYATVVKYVVPLGYGQGNPQAGRPINYDEFNIKRAGGMLFLAGIEQQMSGPLVTMTGRACAVLGAGPTVEHANLVCEASLRHVHGEAIFVRHDIGSPELLQKRVDHMREVRGLSATM